jgi:uncharacterized protein
MKQAVKQELTELDFLYDKQVVCPICEQKVKVRVVKRTSLRMTGRESDSMPTYKYINPLFYDIWLCNYCGHAAQESNFEAEVSKEHISLLFNNVSSRWNYRTYPPTYSLENALERYKLALYSAHLRKAGGVELTMLHLKMGWLFRLKGEKEREEQCLRQALAGFESLYDVGKFPVMGMNESALVYMIADLSYRIGMYKESLLWLAKVLTDINAKPGLKDKCRDLKYLIQQSKKDEEPE